MTEVRYRFHGQPSNPSPFRSRDCATSSSFQINPRCGPTDHRLLRRSTRRGGSLKRFNPSTLQRFNAFTLLELLIVVGIIALLLVLIAPAFTYIKGGTDVTSAAYTIKGVLDTARTYAKANNTYTWVGFYEENVANSASPNRDTPAVGRIVMSTVASKDGTMIYDPTNVGQQNLTTGLTQVGKLTKLENVHLWTHTDVPSGTGETFDSRPNIASTYCIGDASPSNSTTPFQYPVGNPAPGAQYSFVKAVQFSPSGEARVNNSTTNSNGLQVFPLQAAAEIALEPTHGATAPASVPANVVAVQFTGLGGNVKIYRK
jgi:Tfp pilus assembly protein FimT